MTHGRLIGLAEGWLRRQGCRIVLSEQTADCGEIPDAIGWTADCRSIVIECKVSRADFAADRQKLARQRPKGAMGCERWYLAAAGLLKVNEIPQEWGLLQVRQGRVEVVVRPQSGSQRKHLGIMSEMALLLASLRRVEVRIEPQTITEFLKWKNRMAAYNGGPLPQGLVPVEQELATTLQAPRAT
ncbi:MAG: hypothetical protein JO249_06355 [Acidobacteria bacterium]|nr:hypothetical protein [Acidobacteriota bacterium]MBV9480362.1 hypothetical protein [Acidobacteriota bacterium]